MLQRFPTTQFKEEQYCLNLYPNFPKRELLNKPKEKFCRNHLA